MSTAVRASTEACSPTMLWLTPSQRKWISSRRCWSMGSSNSTRYETDSTRGESSVDGLMMWVNWSWLFVSDQRSGMVGVTLQQQPQWHPSWWDGSGKNNPDHCTYYLPHGVQAPQWALSRHCTSVVSTLSFSVVFLFAELQKHFSCFYFVSTFLFIFFCMTGRRY